MKQRSKINITKNITSISKSCLKRWQFMKEVVGKSILFNSNLPRKVAVDRTEIFEKIQISDDFQHYLIRTVPTSK